ncbi:MAG TPA: hypothetical protein VGD47_05430, partial [Steroidobacteraceae bacterium]
RATFGSHKFEMSARLYDMLTDLEGDEFKPFEDSLAEWPIMQHGFRDLTAAHPDSRWLLNRFAYFACIANDANEYRALRARIGAGVWKSAWKGKYSIQACDQSMFIH